MRQLLMIMATLESLTLMSNFAYPFLLMRVLRSHTWAQKIYVRLLTQRTAEKIVPDDCPLASLVRLWRLL
jgi:hypothetical protein